MKRFKYRILLLFSIGIICLSLSGCVTTREVPIEQEILSKKLFIDIGVESPSMIMYDGRYHLFHSGPGISNWVSRDRMNWIRLSPVFATHPDWSEPSLGDSNQIITDPRISQIDDQFYLLYTVHDSDSLRTANGLATNMSLRPSDPNFQWIDRGIVYKTSTKSDAPQHSSASLFADDDGKYWLTAGFSGNRISITRFLGLAKDSVAISSGQNWQAIASSAQLTSGSSQIKPDSSCDDSSINESSSPEFERFDSPQLLSNGSYYYLFFTRWSCDSEGNMAPNVNVGRSEKVDGPYRDSNNRLLTNGGGTLVIQNDSLERDIGQSTILAAHDSHFLVSEVVSQDTDSRSTLAILEITWINGWPVIYFER